MAKAGFNTTQTISDGAALGIGTYTVGQGATDLELAVPAEDALDFEVANARLQTDSVVGGKRVVKATLPSTGSLSVRWQREIPEAAQQQSRVYSEVYTLVGLGDGLMRATSV